MATLAELRDWEPEAHSYWLDCLLAVDEMLSVNSDAPDRESIEALREAQDVALKAGQKVRALHGGLLGWSGPRDRC